MVRVKVQSKVEKVATDTSCDFLGENPILVVALEVGLLSAILLSFARARYFG